MTDTVQFKFTMMAQPTYLQVTTTWYSMCMFPMKILKSSFKINNNADTYPPAFTKDKYHQIVVPLASLAGANSVTELRIKNDNADAATNNTTVFIDEIGLTIDPPLGLLPDLAAVIYDDAVKCPFGMGGGWGGSPLLTVPVMKIKEAGLFQLKLPMQAVGVVRLSLSLG
jgi:hypothetical protein